MEEEISLIQSVFSSRALNWCLLILRLCDEYSYRFPDATEGFSKRVARSCTCSPLETQEPTPVDDLNSSESNKTTVHVCQQRPSEEAVVTVSVVA